jgi:hypothetical protein
MALPSLFTLPEELICPPETKAFFQKAFVSESQSSAQLDDHRAINARELRSIC